MVAEVKRTERGWAGHFCAADRCRFRRNTLLEYGEKRIIVSTVGAYLSPLNNHRINDIGLDRSYETMAFQAFLQGKYWEADVSYPMDFDSPWSLPMCAEGCWPDDIDNHANDMHEAVVAEMMEKIKCLQAK